MSARMRALLALLEEAQAPAVLPLLRIGLCGALFVERLWSLGPALGALAARPDVLDAPLWDALGLPWPPPAALVAGLTWALPLLGLCACIGLCTRVSLALLFLLWLPAGAAQAGWGFFNHTPALPIQLIGVLALVPGSDAWSVDRLLIARLRRTAVTWAPAAPRWGELLALSVMGAFYLTAGISKLRYGAQSWLDGTSLSFYLGGHATLQYWYGPLTPDVARAVWKDGFGIDGYVYLAAPHALSKAIAEHRGLCAVLSWGALGVELAALPALLSSARVRGGAVVVLQVFHVAMNVLIGPAFAAWQVALACAFPFACLRSWWRHWRARSPAPT